MKGNPDEVVQCYIPLVMDSVLAASLLAVNHWKKNLVNPRLPEIVIYLRIVFMHIFSLTGHKPLTRMVRIHPLVLHGQTGCIAAAKLIWSVLILNSSKTSEKLTKVGHFKCITGHCTKIFEAKRWGLSEPLEPPLPTGLVSHYLVTKQMYSSHHSYPALH